MTKPDKMQDINPPSSVLGSPESQVSEPSTQLVYELCKQAFDLDGYPQGDETHLIHSGGNSTHTYSVLGSPDSQVSEPSTQLIYDLCKEAFDLDGMANMFYSIVWLLICPRIP